MVEDVTEEDAVEILIGGVRHPSSIPAQNEDEGDSARKPVN